MSYPGLIAETVKFKGHNGDEGEAYYARPSGSAKVPGVVVIMHMPGWDEWIIETTRKIAHHGFATIAPHLYFREGPGKPDEPTTVKEGDNVLYGKYAGTEVSFEGEDFLIMRESDILAIV